MGHILKTGLNSLEKPMEKIPTDEITHGVLDDISKWLFNALRDDKFMVLYYSDVNNEDWRVDYKNNETFLYGEQ